MTVAFGVVVVRLGAVQVASAERYRELGLDQRVDEFTLASDRGSIFDRDGRDLAVSVPAESVWADPRVIDDPVGYAQRLAPIVGGDEAELAQRLAQRDHAFVYVARKVDDSVAAEVRALDLPGIDFVPESRREYPSGTLAAPLLGFVGLDNDGLGGLEAEFDERLTGTPGQLVVERDPQGREIPNGRRQVTPPERGSDLVLTIDQSIQHEAEQALLDQVQAAAAKGGTAVVLDVRTGDVLAMASVNSAGGGEPASLADHDDRNRAVTDVYEPGSTNKVITVAGALEDGLVGPDTVLSVPDTLELGGFTFEDHDPHGVAAWSVTEILRYSSNIGTIMLGRDLGRERFDHYVREFGFGAPTGVRFPGESPGLILELDQFTDSSMGSMPLGNGLAVTALQMVNVYATIANGGLQREPRLVAATVDSEGGRTDHPVAEPRDVISADTAAALNAMLQQVVADGTGKKAAIPGYPVAGKTGTARKPPYDEHPPYEYVASFAGFAPADHPRLAAIVVLDEPSSVIYGGEVAAPTFARIMQFALRQERVAPSGPVQGSVTRQAPPAPPVQDDAPAAAAGTVSAIPPRNE